jgi:hypothetical protein
MSKAEPVYADFSADTLGGGPRCFNGWAQPSGNLRCGQISKNHQHDATLGFG